MLILILQMKFSKNCDSLGFRNAVPAPFLRVRRQLHRESVRAARRRHRGGSLPVAEQPDDGDAAPEDGADAAGAKVPADVHTMHAPEAVPPDVGRL